MDTIITRKCLRQFNNDRNKHIKLTHSLAHMHSREMKNVFSVPFFADVARTPICLARENKTTKRNHQPVNEWLSSSPRAPKPTTPSSTRSDFFPFAVFFGTDSNESESVNRLHWTNMALVNNRLKKNTTFLLALLS